MNIAYGFFIFIEAMLSIMLIGVILIQKTKGGMGGAAFGGGMGEAIFGSRMGNVLTKTTVILGLVFLLNTLILSALTSRHKGGGSVVDRAPIATQPAPAPVPQPATAPASAPVAAQPSATDSGSAAPIELPAVDAAGGQDAATPADTPAVPAASPDAAQKVGDTKSAK